MRIIFMGTPEFAVPALNALVAAGHEVVGVYTQPPRPAGRGHHETKSAVHARAEALGLAVYTPKTLKSEKDQTVFADLQADVAVVAAYGLILPKAILQAPKYGCLNIHASLLPRWRGAAPIQRAILAGDTETGITIMQMDEGLDTGAMLAKSATSIAQEDTATTLHDELSKIGADLIVKVVCRLEEGEQVTGEVQDENLVTYAEKLTKGEGRIDWAKPAVEIDRQVRALTPWPGVWFMAGEQRVKLYDVELIAQQGVPGAILDRYMTVACGEGALRLNAVQPQNKKTMPGAAYLNGTDLGIGDILS